MLRLPVVQIVTIHLHAYRKEEKGLPFLGYISSVAASAYAVYEEAAAGSYIAHQSYLDVL